MKSIKKLFIFLTLFTIINSLSNNLLVATKYACCTPFGSCSYQLFTSKYACMQACSAHHECVTKDEDDTEPVATNAVEDNATELID